MTLLKTRGEKELLGGMKTVSSETPDSCKFFPTRRLALVGRRSESNFSFRSFCEKCR